MKPFFVKIARRVFPRQEQDASLVIPEDFDELDRVAKQHELARTEKARHCVSCGEGNPHSYFGGAMMTVGFLLCASGLFFTAGTAVVLGLLLCTGGYGISARARKHEHSVSIGNTHAVAAEYIPQFLRDRLACEREQVIGNITAFGKLHTESIGALQRARILQEQIRARCAAFEKRQLSLPDYLASMRDRITTIVKTCTANHEKLEGYRVRAAAFFKECDAHISGISGPIGDLMLARELTMLDEQAEHLRVQVEHEIINTTAKLVAGMARLTIDYQQAVESGGTALAAAQPTIALLERTVADFVPAKDSRVVR